MKFGIFPNGVNNAYFTTANYGCLHVTCTGAAYREQVCAYQSDKLMEGDPTALSACFLESANGSFDNSLLPADVDSSTPPLSGEDEVLLGSVNRIDQNTGMFDNLYLYKFHVDWSNPANSALYGVGGTMPISVASFNPACGGNPGTKCIPQPNGIFLRALGDRLMYRLAYRNFVYTESPQGVPPPPNHEQWVVSHSVCISGCSGGMDSQVGIRWYELWDLSERGNPTVFDQGTFAPNDGQYRWLGSIASDRQGNLLLGYSESSSTQFPSVYYTGRLASDPPGTMEAEAPNRRGG